MPRIDESNLDSASRSRNCARWACPPNARTTGPFHQRRLYGLYTNLERPTGVHDRVFPGEERGELWTAPGSSRSTRIDGAAAAAPRRLLGGKDTARSPRSPTWTRRCSSGRPRRCSPIPTAIDRPLELLHLQPPDARMAVAAARPRRDNRLDRSADRPECTKGRQRRLVVAVAALRRGAGTTNGASAT